MLDEFCLGSIFYSLQQKLIQIQNPAFWLECQSTLDGFLGTNTMKKADFKTAQGASFNNVQNEDFLSTLIT